MDLRRVIIVGSGIYGLVAAKTYLQINPKVDLTIIEKDETVGGVWSVSRIYPGLIVDGPTPMFEFSDMQMSDECDTPKWSDVPGELAHKYLERYAEKFDLLPLVLHSRGLQKRYSDLASEQFKTVVIVGGNKSAVKAAGLCALAGKKIHWAIRKDGAGTTLLMNPRQPNGEAAAKTVMMRWLQFNIPTIYRYRGWWDRLVLSGNNALGRKFFDWFWNLVTKRGLGDRYERSENGRLLQPDILSVFWTPTSLSMAHEAEIKLFDIIDEGKMVKFSRAYIESMKDCSVHFSDGSTVETDVATGWQNASNSLFSPDLATELGLSVPCGSLSGPESSHCQDLDLAADKQVLEAYPMLANPPPQIKPVPRTETQLRQLRTIVPPKLAHRDDRSIVFLGQLNNAQNFYFAEISALWAVTYLERLLPVDSFTGHFDDMSKEIALQNAFMRWRYPGRKNTPYAVLEIRDWIDVLLRDMGIRTDRNRFRWKKENPGKWTWWGWRPWFAEWFEPYEPVAYRGIVDELFKHVKEREEKSIAM